MSSKHKSSSPSLKSKVRSELSKAQMRYATALWKLAGTMQQIRQIISYETRLSSSDQTYHRTRVNDLERTLKVSIRENWLRTRLYIRTTTLAKEQAAKNSIPATPEQPSVPGVFSEQSNSSEGK